MKENPAIAARKAAFAVEKDIAFDGKQVIVESGDKKPTKKAVKRTKRRA